MRYETTTAMLVTEKASPFPLTLSAENANIQIRDSAMSLKEQLSHRILNTQKATRMHDDMKRAATAVQCQQYKTEKKKGQIATLPARSISTSHLASHHDASQEACHGSVYSYRR